MKKIDPLFALIKSLSGNEKKSFRIFSSRHVAGKKNIYLMLFEAIARQEIYDKAGLKKELEGTSLLRNLPSVKKYLFSLIMRSLRNYHNGHNAGIRLHEMLIDYDILFRKGQYGLCLKSLTAAKREAEKYDRPDVLIGVMLQERKLRDFIDGIDDLSLDDLFEEFKKTLGILKNRFHYDHISRKIFEKVKSNIYIRDRDHQREIRRLMNSPFMRNEKMINGPFMLSKYLQTWGMFFSSKGELKKAIEVQRRLVQYFYEHPYLVEDSPWRYLAACINLVNSLMTNSDFSEAEMILDRLDEFRKKLRKTEAISVHYFEYISASHLTLGVTEGEFEKAIASGLSIVKDMEDYQDRISFRLEKYMYAHLAQAYFGAGKYHLSIKWINRVLHDPRAKGDSEVEGFIRITQLLAHFELGNKNLIEYAVKWAYRFFLKRNKSAAFERAILDFLKGSRKINTRTELRNGFLKLRKQLLVLCNDPTERLAIHGFQIIPWLESKIYNKPFAELVKEHAHKKSGISENKITRMPGKS